MNKKNIVIVIDDLGIGGAEMLLVGILPDLNERYNVILVTLTDKNDYGDKAFICKHKYTLGLTGKWSFFRCISHLRKIIKLHQPVLVHSHLFYSNFIARVACPANIHCFYTIHSLLSNDIFKSKVWKRIEKQTIKKNQSVIAVSEDVLKDYQCTITKNKQAFVLENYISDVFISVSDKIIEVKKDTSKLKLVAVGNIKKVKNYQLLIKGFLELKAYNVSLDIYGLLQEENIWQELKEIIETNQLPITYKGKFDNIQDELTKYDLFVMPSFSEGFGIAAIEAMAIGLPLLLSDIPTLKHITYNNALFFDPQNPTTFATLVKQIIGGTYDLDKLSKDGKEIVQNNYTKKIYLKKLDVIYDTAIKI